MEFFLVRISLYSARKQEHIDQKKLRIWTLLTQCSKLNALMHIQCNSVIFKCCCSLIVLIPQHFHFQTTGVWMMYCLPYWRVRCSHKHLLCQILQKKKFKIKNNLNKIFTLLCGTTNSFMRAITAFWGTKKPFEVPQRSVKIKI